MAIRSLAAWLAAFFAASASGAPLDAPEWSAVKPELTDTPEMVAPWRPAAPPDFSRHPEAHVGRVGGTPCFFVQGKPFFAMWGAVWRWKNPGARAITGGMPFNVVTVFNDHRKWYPRTGVFDPKNLDLQARDWIRDNPDSYLVWDLTVTPPNDWAEANPDEMCTDSEGEVTKDGLRANWSFASAKALDVMLDIVTRAVGYLESQPYANRIIGYRVNSGHTMEWLGWYPKAGRATDFSAAAKERFLPLDIPSLAERVAPDGETVLWDAGGHAAAAKWARFYSENGADALISLCRRVKGLTGGRKLVGTYYGYTMTLNRFGNSVLRGGHYALKKVLDSGVVDFLLSPHPYETRYLGGICGEMKPFASLQMHGVVPVVEDDTRTHNGPWLERGNYGQTLTEAQSRGVLRRNMAFALCRGEPPYNYALIAGSELGFAGAAEDGMRLKEIGERCLRRGVGRHAEVAIVVSENSILASPVTTFFGWPSGFDVQRYGKDGRVERRPGKAPLFTGDAFGENYVRFSRAGAPVDYLLAEDLATNPGDYKLYVFVNAFRTDDAFRKAVAALRERGATLLWLYAPGAQDGEGLGDERAMEALTGMLVRRETERHSAEARMVADGRIMGQPGAHPKPLFSLARAENVLGTYTNGNIAVGMMRTGKGMGVFSGVWSLDVPFIRDVMRRAGVHLYSDTSDPMEANDALVALHARFPGRKSVRLPRRASVLDVFGRRIVAHDADAFSFDAPLHSTSLFYLFDAAQENPVSRMDRTKLLIGGYRLSHSRDHHLADMKACGIDFITGVRVTDRGSLDRLAKHGIGAVAKGVLPHWCGEHGEKAGQAQILLPLDRYAAAADAYYSEGLDHPAIWMLNFVDEPSAKDMSHLGRAAACVASRIPHVPVYCNLYPSYAKVQETGNAERRSQLGTATYREYIDAYCRTSPLDYICFDYYMYMPRRQDRYKLYAGLYGNLKAVAEACRRTGRSLWFVPQVNSRFSDPLVPLSADNLRFQANTALAFGAEALVWACYGKGWWTNNVLVASGEKTQQYEKLKTVNAELHALGPEYMRFKNVATHFVGFVPSNGLERLDVPFVGELDAGAFKDVHTREGTPLLAGEMVPRSGAGDMQALFLVPSADPFGTSPAVRTVVFRLSGAGWSARAFGAHGNVELYRAPDGACHLQIAENAAVLLVAEHTANGGTKR